MDAEGRYLGSIESSLFTFHQGVAHSSGQFRASWDSIALN